jgi:hypothetical protein
MGKGRAKENSITSDDLKAIEAAAKMAANETVLMLKTENMLKGKRNAFQKTELLLYNYTKFRDVIADKDQQIKSIKLQGLPKKSKSITSWGGNTNQEPESDMEKAENKIAEIEKSIAVTRRLIKVIDKALEKVSDDPYFNVIQMFYFEGVHRDDIIKNLNCDTVTMYRNKKRIVDRLKMDLFSDDAITEIFYS